MLIRQILLRRHFLSFPAGGPRLLFSTHAPTLHHNNTRKILNLTHPSSIRPNELNEPERSRFMECREAVLHHDYNQVVDMVQNVHLEPSPIVVTALLESLGQMGRVAQMEQALQKWLQGGNKATLIMAEVLIDHFLLRGFSDKAKLWLNIFEKRHGVRAGVGLDNLWITFYLRNNNLPKAKQVFDEFRSRGVHPNRQTFHSFYRHFIKTDDFAAAEQCKSAMLAAGFTPNIAFYNLQLTLFFNKMMLKEVEDVLKSMAEQQIPKESSTFDILVAGFAKCGQKEAMEQWMLIRNQESPHKMTQRSYAKLIEAMGMNMTAEQCRDLFHDLESVKDANKQFNVTVYYSLAHAFLEQGRFDEALELFQEIQRLDLAMTEPLYTQILKICIDTHFYYGLSFVEDEMKKHGIVKGALMYSTLIKYHLKKNNYDRVDEYLKSMYREGVALSEKMLYQMITHLCEQSHYNRVREILNWLLENNKSVPHLHISDRLQTAIQNSLYVFSNRNLGGFLRRCKNIVDRDVDTDDNFDYGPPDVRAIQQKMTTSFPMVPFKPTVHIFNDILVTCLKNSRFQDVAVVFGEMRRQNISPNRFTFTYLIKSRLWMGQPQEAYRLLYDMCKYGIRPDQFQFGLVHHAHCRLGLTSEAERLLSEMQTVFHVPPNHVLYASLLFAHCRRFEYAAVFRTFETMERSGLRPDTETSNYVLLSLFDVGEYAEAMQFFSKMCFQGIKRNTYTYTILADRMLARDDVEGVLAVLNDGFLDGNTIDSFPLGRILSYLHARMAFKDVERVVDLMVKLGVRLDSHLTPYCVLAMNRKFDAITRLDKAGDIGNRDEVVKEVRMLVEKGLIDADRDTSEDDTISNEESAFWDGHKRLLQFYQETKQKDQQESLQLFTEHLPEIRKCFLKNHPFLEQNTRFRHAPSFDEGPSISDLLMISRAQQTYPNSTIFQ